MQTYTIQNMSGDSMWVPAMFGFILAGILTLLFGAGLLILAWKEEMVGRVAILVLGIWLQGIFILLFTTLFLMSSYYAKRPHITHPFSTFLCKIFYITYENKSKPGHLVRFRRMWVVITGSLLCLALIILRFIS